MHEFDVALHHNVVLRRKKRLVVLMALDSPNDVYVDDDDLRKVVLRQYLRQYTYVNFKATGWLDNLLYALPLHGMDQQHGD